MSSLFFVSSEMKCRIDEIPAKMCGASVLEITGRENEFVSGAGVESVLQTVRMFVITHAGASVIAEAVLGRVFIPAFRDDRGVAVCLAEPLAVLFTGVCLLEVL